MSPLNSNQKPDLDQEAKVTKISVVRKGHELQDLHNPMEYKGNAK